MSWRSMLILMAIGLADVALFGWFWVSDRFQRKESQP